MIRGEGPLCDAAGSEDWTIGVTDRYAKWGYRVVCNQCGRGVGVCADGTMRQHRTPETLFDAAEARRKRAIEWRNQRRAELRASLGAFERPSW